MTEVEHSFVDVVGQVSLSSLEKTSRRRKEKDMRQSEKKEMKVPEKKDQKQVEKKNIEKQNNPHFQPRKPQQGKK
jgi:hypothetical protein